MNKRNEQLMELYFEFGLVMLIGLVAVFSMLGAMVTGYYGMYEPKIGFLWITFWFTIMVIARTWNSPIRTFFVKIRMIDDEPSLVEKHERLYNNTELWSKK